MKTLKFFRIDFSKEEPVLSKKLMFFGSFFLVISFVIQNFSYQKWDSEIDSINQANRDYSDIIRSALLYEILYFNVNTPDTILLENAQSQYIKTAAEKIRLGKIIAYNTDSLGTPELNKKFIDNTNLLLAANQNVTDFSSFINYINMVNSVIPENRSEKANRITKLNSKKERASFWFLIMQILGSLLLIIGIRYQ